MTVFEGFQRAPSLSTGFPAILLAMRRVQYPEQMKLSPRALLCPVPSFSLVGQIKVSSNLSPFGRSDVGLFVSLKSDKRLMLHCNMSASGLSLQLGLENLLGDLRFARKAGDLGRLALLAYCEVRRWARMAGEQELAKHSSELINNIPFASRDEFMAEVDALIVELEQAHLRVAGSHG